MEHDIAEVISQFPLLPLTDPMKQLNAVMKLWTVWAGPVRMKYAGRQMILLPMEYYLESLSLPPGEVKKIQEEMEKDDGI